MTDHRFYRDDISGFSMPTEPAPRTSLAGLWTAGTLAENAVHALERWEQHPDATLMTDGQSYAVVRDSRGLPRPCSRGLPATWWQTSPGEIADALRMECYD